MEKTNKTKVILRYIEKSIEIILPDNFKDLFKIFIDNFKIEKNMEEYLEITYNDDEGDNIGLYSEEDFKAFRKLLIEKTIKNELIGKIISNSKRTSINKSFNTELDNLQQFLMGKSTNKNDYEKNNNKSNNSLIEINLEDIDNENKEKKILEEELKSKVEEINKLNSEVKILKEEKEKQEKEFEKKDNEIKKDYEGRINIINLENIKLKEENQEKEEIINEYSKNIKEQEKNFNEKLTEYNKKNEIEKNNIKLLEEKDNIIKKREEDKKNLLNKNKDLIKEVKNLKKKLEELKFNNEHKEKKNNNNNNNINNDNNLLIRNIFEEQSKEYKTMLDNIKKEYIIELNKKFEEIKNNKYDNNNKIYDEINKSCQEIINNYLKKSENFEIKRKNDLYEKINEKKKVYLSLNETIHEGIKCNICHANPIIGERYKCSICPNYNLCKECEEENAKNLQHKHNFIKIRYANIENKNDINKKDLININYIKNEKNENIINDDKNGRKNVDIKTNNLNKEIYSFEIINFIKDKYLVYCGTKKFKIKLIIKNESNFEYPEETQIKFNEKNSTLNPSNQIIKINKLHPKESQNISINYDDKDNIVSGNYYSSFNFIINEEIIGEFKINIKILENNDFELVELLKKEYNIFPNNSDNNDIIKILKKCSNDFNKTLNYFLDKDEKQLKSNKK